MSYAPPLPTQQTYVITCGKIDLEVVASDNSGAEIVGITNRSTPKDFEASMQVLFGLIDVDVDALLINAKRAGKAQER